MKKKLLAICLVLVVSMAVLGPSCVPLGGPPPISTILIQATLDGTPWTGAVTYNLTGPGAPISGTSVPASHTVVPGTWTCAYVSGGPPGADFVSITPSATQILPAGGNITFTLLGDGQRGRAKGEQRIVQGAVYAAMAEARVGNITGGNVSRTSGVIDTAGNLSIDPYIAGGVAQLKGVWTVNTTGLVASGKYPDPEDLPTGATYWTYTAPDVWVQKTKP